MKLIGRTLPFLNSLKIAGFVSVERFFFVISKRGHSLAEAFLRENIGFWGQKEVISVFEIGHLWDDGSVNSASYGSPLPDR